jgi:phage anti-repressor protein
MKKLLSIFLACLLLAGCKKTVDGEAFIVTKNGDAVKLSGITVALIPAENIQEKYIKESLHRYRDIKEDVSKLPSDKYTDSFNKYIESNNRLKALYEEAEKEKKLIKNDDYSGINKRNKIEEKKLDGEEGKYCAQAIDSVQSESTRILNDLKAIEKKVEDKYGSGHHFDDFLSREASRSEVIKTITDSEGKFKLEFDSNNDYYLFAEASREAQFETYTWVLKSKNFSNEKIILTQNNSYKSPDEYLSDYFEKPKEISEADFESILAKIDAFSNRMPYDLYKTHLPLQIREMTIPRCCGAQACTLLGMTALCARSCPEPIADAQRVDLLVKNLSE